ncbi:meiosis-specific nuclear structural protein 1 [Drosophila innubila]|uniref:meiosis-specific nuclear structural protein 1 n=1 Tax=Drosophila innubila TaxID=198719 RepID=UPI00148C85C2|nr:meiosis-specific nuclear structural protein 1 [Drosophila innubila]
MTTPTRTFLCARDALPAIHITGRPKIFVKVDEDLVFKNFKFFSEMMNETQLKNTELSEENPLRQQAAHAEVVMSEELKKLKHQEFVDRKRRQQLRTDCGELRELAEQLRLAAITKDLEDHMAERNKSRQLAKEAKAKGFERAEAERLRQLAKEQEEEQLKKERQKVLHETLSSQIEETRQRRQKQCVQTAAEREERLAIQKKIQEEDRAEQLQLNRLKQKKLQSQLEFIEIKKEYNELQRAKSDENIAKVFEKQLEMAEQKRMMEEAKKEAQRRHQEISLQIGNEVLEIENRKRQRHNLLLDLLQAEYKAKDDERFRQQLEQEQLERRRARQELERYRADMMERQLEQARLRQKQIVERTHDCIDNREILEISKEREQRKQHGALLLSMIEENNRRRAEAAAENLQFFDLKAKTEAELQNRIQEERLQMLGSVPASVLRYLPKQVLSDSDRERFNLQTKQQSLQHLNFSQKRK